MSAAKTVAKAVVPVTPKLLAETLNVDPKNLRTFLRKNFARPAEAKNTSWILPEDAITAAKAHFTKQEAKS